MANEEGVLREVDQELAEERQWAMFREQGPRLIGAALAIVLGVAGWQLWNAQKDSTAKKQALEFKNAIELLEEDQDAGRAALQAVVEEGGGYSVLAQLHRASSYARGGERLKAVEIYREIYHDGGAPKSLRELARLRAAHLSLADNRDQVLADLGDLTVSDSLYGVYAREIAAIAALGAKDYEPALSTFRALAIDVSAPQAVRRRAEDFAALAAAGKAGVNITGEAKVEDLIEAVGVGTNANAADAAVPEELHEAGDHAGDAADEAPVVDQKESDAE